MLGFCWFWMSKWTVLPILVFWKKPKKKILCVQCKNNILTSKLITSKNKNNYQKDFFFCIWIHRTHTRDKNDCSFLLLVWMELNLKLDINQRIDLLVLHVPFLFVLSKYNSYLAASTATNILALYNFKFDVAIYWWFSYNKLLGDMGECIFFLYFYVLIC